MMIESPCGCLLTREQVRTLIGRYGYAVGGGRPREENRCPCGLYTRARAAARGHRCEAAEKRKGKRNGEKETNNAI